MFKTRTVLFFFLIWVLATSVSVSAQRKKMAQAGWISDQACGAQHAKAGGAGADCVRKCWRGGASVGHPEWKPQPAIFVTDKDHSTWLIENPDAVKQFPAMHVMVNGKFDSVKKTIHIDKISASAS